jgi:phosphate transport system protein
MLGRILDALSKKKTLLDDARQDALMMLVSGRRMFDLVLVAMKEEAGAHIRAKIGAMDKDLNRQQREVRRKVFEHLSLSSGQDLQQGLELITAVIDLERIGDYTKNISELVEMMPDKLHFGEYEDTYHQVQTLATQVFDRSVDAFAKSDVESARLAISAYEELALTCDTTLEKLLTRNEGNDCGDSIPRGYVGLTLMLRYLKRVAAHLKNVSSAIVNPFHRIGYRPKV